jgi:3-oxoacyl-[acyl-carrier-protein] synthase-3
MEPSLTVRARFAGLGKYLPERVLTNHDLERLVETSDEWILDRTGIAERRMAADNETASTMGIEAARQALAQAQIDAADLDLVIVATTTPDGMFPSVASLVQNGLGARRAGAFDINAACVGFVTAIATASQFIASGAYQRVLVVGSDVLSRIVDWQDRGTCVLFGDGAGAVVVRRVERGGILATHTHADGRYGDLLYSDPVVGSQLNGSPRDFAHETTGARPFIHMDGRRVYAIAVETMVRDVCRVIEKWNASSGERITAADVDYVYPHQANLRIVEMVAKRLGVPVERVYTGGVVRYGNTSTASIPLGYWDNRDRFREGGGRLEVDVAFGAGFASGAILRRVG